MFITHENMAQTAQLGASKSGDVAAAQGYEKKRAALFEASEEEKRRIKQESAAYRLKDEADKFSSSSNAVEVSLSQATVGLMSKEEFARRKAALDNPEKEGPPPAAEPAEKKEKKKKKKAGGGLSFAFDDLDGGGDGGGGDAVPSLKKKPRPSVEPVATASSATASAPVEADAADASSSAASGAATVPLPTGYACIRRVTDGALELQCEVRAGSGISRSRVTDLAAHAIAFDVKAPDRYEQVGPIPPPTNTAGRTALRAARRAPLLATPTPTTACLTHTLPPL